MELIYRCTVAFIVDSGGMETGRVVDCALPVRPGRSVTTNYMIATLTGKNKPFIPASANVFIQLEGEWCKGGVMCLDNPINQLVRGPPFSRPGQCDVFEFRSMGSVGDIRSIHVWHDNTGSSPSWLLDKIEVHDSNAGYIYRFACGYWLSHLHDNIKAISLKLPCSGKKIQRLPPSPTLPFTLNTCVD